MMQHCRKLHLFEEFLRHGKGKGHWRSNIKKQKGWRFRSRHAADIDFVKIAEDLTTKNPVALVRAEDAGPDDQVWLVVHYKIVMKADIMGMSLLHCGHVMKQHPLGTNAHPTRNHIAWVVRMPLKDTKKVVEAIRDMKRWPWPRDEDNIKRTIVVTTPEI